MEVHHHAGLSHKKKNFREYFFEFLMIFLAVILRFLAENLRERISDHKKEREYIESLVQDLKSDTTLVAKTINRVNSQMYGMDTLEMLLTPEINKNDSAVYISYRQREYLHDENTMNFSNRTITQLFSSGNMRLLKKQSVSDQITDYYSAVKAVDAQKEYYKNYFNKCMDIYQAIYEFDTYHTKTNLEGNIVMPEFIYGKIHIANSNAGDLKKYKSTIEFTKQIIGSYRTDIERLKKQADSLIGYLTKEYGLS